jgi:hypothetical protein
MEHEILLRSADYAQYISHIYNRYKIIYVSF